MQCQARAKATGDQCRRRAVAGRRVCTVHGGLTPIGLAHPNFKSGRYSRALPGRLLERFHASETDPDLLDLRQEIAVIDARIEDLLARADRGDSDAVWRRLVDLVHDVQAAVDAGRALDEPLAELGRIATDGGNDFATWREITGLIDQRRRLVLAESRRLATLGAYITTSEALAFVEALAQSVQANVTDRDALNRIANDFGRLTNRADLAHES